MWILQLAWKNLWRNKSRTAITMAAVSFATIISMLAASLKEGIFNNLIKNIVSIKGSIIVSNTSMISTNYEM